MNVSTRQKSIEWWNKLGKIRQDDLAFDYYGSNILMDSEIEILYLVEVPQEITFTKEEVIKLVKSFADDCESDENLYSYYGRDINGNKILTDCDKWLNDFFARK